MARTKELSMLDLRTYRSKQVMPYQGREVDLMTQEHLTPDFLKINPKGLVPVLVHNEVPISESTVILEYLEDAFPEKSLRPSSPLH